DRALPRRAARAREDRDAAVCAHHAPPPRLPGRWRRRRRAARRRAALARGRIGARPRHHARHGATRPADLMLSATQALTVIAELAPDRRAALEDRLAAIAADPEHNAVFRPGELPDTHFMRFVIVD